MDKNEHIVLSGLPAHALSLRLARTPIRMNHGKTWFIDKINSDHDLVICLSGRGKYLIDNRQIEIGPGKAMLIPAYQRFRGQHGGGEEIYTGIAQHFALEMFGKGDVITQVHLATPIELPNWDMLKPLVMHYREAHHGSATSLAAHHQFMVLLLAYLDAAVQGWRTDTTHEKSEDQLSVQIMLAATRLSADPLGAGAMDEAMSAVPYNEDYFRRAFRDRIGLTPQKFRELKRMEFAVHRLRVGLSVKEVAAELGYNDPYFFSRMFKQYMGTSPSKYHFQEHDRHEQDM